MAFGFWKLEFNFGQRRNPFMLRLITTAAFILIFPALGAAADDAAAPKASVLPTVCTVVSFGDKARPADPLFSGPTSRLAEDEAGNLYSTTSDGGRYRKGVAYKVTPDGDITTLYEFKGDDLG